MPGLIRVVGGGALVTRCTPPTNLSVSATNVGYSQGVTLSWSGAAGGAGNPIQRYEIYRATSANGAYGYLASSETTSCAVTSPASNGSYFYKIRAIGKIRGFDSEQSSAYAELVTVVRAVTAPTSVSLAATVVDAGATTTLRWSGAAAGTNNAITGYEIWRATGGSYAYLQTVRTTATSGSVEVTASGTMGGKHYYKVKTLGTHAGFESGLSSGEAVLTAQTYSAVGAPTNLSVSATNVGYSQGVTLSWSGAKAGTNNPITGYEIWRSTSANGTYSRLTSVTTSATSGSVSVTSPASNGSYYYKVKTLGTKSGFADSGLSGNYATLTSRVTAPAAPTAISLSANNVRFNTNVTLSWSGASAGANNPITKYRVYRCTDGVNYVYLLETTATNCTVTSPGSNTGWHYRVYARGTYEPIMSPISGVYAYLVSVVTAPSVPGSVRLDATDLRVGKTTTLRWNASSGGTNNPVAKYQVYRNGAYLTETTGTSCTVTAPGNDGGQYTYTVYAIGTVSGWNSGASAGATLTGYTEKYTYYAYSSNTTFTVPGWAERVDLCCIGAGGPGSPVGGGYDQYGGGGGGAGYINNLLNASVRAGESLAISVGQSVVGSNGGTTTISKAGSALLSAAGGKTGRTFAGNDYWQHWQRDPSNVDARSGGDGMAGGGSGGCGTAAEANGAYARPGGAGTDTLGGWGLCSEYGITGANGGSYKGANGADATGYAWGSGNKSAAAVGKNCDDYYPFGDRNCGYYAAARGGNGGAGKGTGTPGGGGWGAVPGADATGAALRGTGYGAGGNGGSYGDPSPSAPTAGGSGLALVRVWRYLS